jgi:hypothetical protein
MHNKMTKLAIEVAVHRWHSVLADTELGFVCLSRPLEPPLWILSIF